MPARVMLQLHPLAAIFPLLEGDEFAELMDDIHTHGVREAIWLYDGQILDGRNRYMACQALGIDCPTRLYVGDDPVEFVVSMNLRRRHLNESQRGMIAARLATLEAHRPAKTAGIPAVSQTEAAQMLKVSRDTVQQARKVQQEGAPEVAQAVDVGEMTLTAALPLTTLPKEVQPGALEDVRREAAGKKPTTTQTNRVVQRLQTVAMVKAALAVGMSPEEAINQALLEYDTVKPTPPLVEAIVDAIEEHMPHADTEDVRVAFEARATQEAARATLRTQGVALVEALECLANIVNSEGVLAEMPPYLVTRMDRVLPRVLTTLNHLAWLRSA